MKEKRVVIYCRVARDEHFSLKAQAATLQNYARQAGYTIIGVVSDCGNGLSIDRPALNEVTQAVLDGRVDLVLVNSITRIGREWGLTKQYVNLLLQHKVKLICVKESLLFSPEDITLIPHIKKAECHQRNLSSFNDTPHGPSVHNGFR